MPLLIELVLLPVVVQQISDDDAHAVYLCLNTYPCVTLFAMRPSVAIESIVARTTADVHSATLGSAVGSCSNLFAVRPDAVAHPVIAHATSDVQSVTLGSAMIEE